MKVRPHLLPYGTRIKILDILPRDAYYADRKRLIGKTGTAQGSILMDNENGHSVWPFLIAADVEFIDDPDNNYEIPDEAIIREGEIR